MTRISVGLRLAAAALVATASALAIPAFSAPASAAISGRTVVYGYTGFDSTNKGLRVDCPSGMNLVGTSFSMGGGEGQVRWDQVTPYSDHLYVHASEDDDGFGYGWSLGVALVCANPMPGYEIVASTSTTTSNPSNSVPVFCTGSHVLLGMGFAISTGGGEVGIDDFTASTSYATGTAYEDANGFAGSWNLTMYAICADKPAGYEIVSVKGNDTSQMSATLTANCTSGKRTLGGGGQITGGTGRVILEDFDDGLASYEVKAYEDQNGITSNWHLDAYAICADK
jgi:hypothetical protein